MGWYGVRSVYLFEAAADGDVYEERVVIIEAASFDGAIAKAEKEAAEYVAGLGDGEVLPLFQSYRCPTTEERAPRSSRSCARVSSSRTTTSITSSTPARSERVQLND